MAEALRNGPARTGRTRYSSLVAASAPATDSDSNWLITLSDILTLLLVVFVMIFAMSRSSAKTASVKTVAPPQDRITEPSAPAPVARQAQQIRDEMSAGIARLEAGDDVTVTARDREVIVTLREKVTFRPGEAEILQGLLPVLDEIAQIIRRNPTLSVDIEGHTDSVPIRTRRYPSNWELSAARATSVLKYLVVRHDIAPSRLSVRGNADQRPIASNDTPQERAANRRVEIRLRETPAE